MTRLRDTTLPIAFAASVAVHVSTFAVLVGVDGGPGPAARASAPPPAPALEARLVAAATPAERAPEGPTVPPAVAALSLPAAAPEPPDAAPLAARPSPGAATDKPSPLGWKPRVVINDRVPRARFGEALDGDALAAFPIEVDVAIVLPERIEVPYPRSALAARKEGTVLVWAVIDEHGRVDSTHVVEGDPELAQAVETALARTRFAPARNLGRNVPFYVTLEIEFRLDATGGGTVAAERAAAGAR